MRAHVNDFEKLAKSPTCQSLICSETPPFMHVATLSKNFQFLNVLDNLKSVMQLLEGAFATFWTMDTEAVACAIEEACPRWTHVKQTLLSEPATQKLLLDNINKHYSKIGPLSQEMKRQVGLFKDVHKDGRGILRGLDIEYVSAKEQLADMAIETVAFTYLLWHLIEIVKTPGPLDIAARDKKLTARTNQKQQHTKKTKQNK